MPVFFGAVLGPITLVASGGPEKADAKKPAIAGFSLVSVRVYLNQLNLLFTGAGRKPAG